jgi:hypothetical protein
MGQSLTVTVNHNPFLDGRMPEIIILDWVCDSGAAVSKKIAATYSAAQLAATGNNPSVAQPVKIRGEIALIETVPGLNGDLSTSKPTSAYSMTLLDDYGRDVAGGVFATCSITVAEAQIPQKTIQIDSELTLTISGTGGDAKKGRVIIHLKESENRP